MGRRERNQLAWRTRAWLAPFLGLPRGAFTLARLALDEVGRRLKKFATPVELAAFISDGLVPAGWTEALAKDMWASLLATGSLHDQGNSFDSDQMLALTSTLAVLRKAAEDQEPGSALRTTIELCSAELLKSQEELKLYDDHWKLDDYLYQYAGNLLSSPPCNHLMVWSDWKEPPIPKPH